MKGETKLTLIKVIHTLIWMFFNLVIFYMLYAAIALGFLSAIFASVFAILFVLIVIAIPLLKKLSEIIYYE
jgi:hypothetical protein